MYGDYEGTLKQVLNLLMENNHQRAVFVASLNAALARLGRIEGSIHCRDETKRGHTLGRVLWEGSAIPNTGIPGEVKGFGAERVIRAPGPGTFRGVLSIGEHVEKGDVVAYAGDAPVLAPISGMLRGYCSKIS